LVSGTGLAGVFRFKSDPILRRADSLGVSCRHGLSGQGSKRVNAQLLVDSIPALIHTAMPDGYLDYFNKPWLEYLGVTLDKVAGWHWTAFIHPEDLDGIVAKWRACLATGEVFEYETRVRRANGEYRWMFHRKVPLRDANGTIVKWYGSSFDIEERKGAEQKIREQETELRNLLDLMPQQVFVFGPDGSPIYANQGAFEYFGADADQLLSKSRINFVHPDDREYFLAERNKALLTEAPHEFEARLLRHDGVFRWFLFRRNPLKDERGHILRWYGTGTDIEDRKRTEEKVRMSEFYLSEGQRLAHIGSWAFDPGGFYYWSPELFRMHGLDPASKPPAVQEYLDRVHQHDRESMADLFKGILAKASPFDATKRIVRPNGEVRYIRCVGAPVVENQSLKKYVGSALDVTEHELLTQELRRREAYLAEAQRLSHTGSFGWKVPSGEIFWSDETFRIFEYDRSVKPTIDLVVRRLHPQDRADFQKVIDGASRGATHFEHTYRLLLSDGRVKHVHALAHATRDKSGGLEYVGAAQDVTRHRIAEDQRKKAAEALQASERDLRSIIRAIPTMVWSTAPDGSVDFFNPRWLDYTGLSPDQSRDWRWTAAIHPDDLSRLTDAWQSILVSEEPGEAEARLRRFDGAYRWFLFRANPLRDESGNIVKWYGINFDIEDRKRAEEALRRSESYLAEAQRLSQTGSWAWSPDLTGDFCASPNQDIRYWSEECYRVLSFDPQDGLPRFEEFFRRIHPDDQPGVRELIQTAIREKTEWEADYRIVHPGGAIRDIHVVGHPVLTTSGHLREFVGTVIDVTERKRAEEELRRSEMELRQIVDLVPQLIAVYGTNFERFYANRITLDYLGVGLDEWQQKTFAHSTHPDDLERLKASTDRALSSGSAYEVELRLRKHDGSYRWFLARYNPVRDDKGQITRWYVTATDIEDRKQAEDTLRRENVVLREEIEKTSMFEEIVGTSPALKAVLSRISKVAPSDSTVLITGETGTGKELVARAIHRRSNRTPRAFVSVNCAAIPRDLIASELFGHERGAFTGATQQRVGRFELANGGTLFLDEVGELPAETQIALLRVLQEHEFERVGGIRKIHADVRVIAATNRDLQATISAGSFRSDLFYRLNVFPIEIPALRERKEDIRLLVEYFIDRYARKAGKKITTVDKKTLRLLESYPWPGNIRELQNVIERSVIVCETENFSVDESWLSQQPPERRAESQLYLSEKVAAQEKEIIEAALRECQGRVFGPSGAAAKLGIARSTLESKIRSLKINKNRFKT
jgi:PAS domain S-box-containing protein